MGEYFDLKQPIEDFSISPEHKTLDLVANAIDVDELIEASIERSMLLSMEVSL